MVEDSILMDNTQKVQIVQLIKSPENETGLTPEQAFNLPQESFTNETFKRNTGLYVNWLDGLSSEEKWQVYVFLTKTKAGQKFAKNFSKKYKERITANQKLGIKIKEMERNFRNQIANIKEDFDKKMADFYIEANRIFKETNDILNKDITKSDLKKPINLIGMNLWS